MSARSDTHKTSTYLEVFGALAVLTALAVTVAYQDLGHPWGVIVPIAIASCQATLVALFFMRLRFEMRPIYIVAGVPLVLTAVLILALGPDIAGWGR